MVNFYSFAVVALAGSSMALHVSFKRYSQPNCPATNHIDKDTDLRDGKCKTFSHHEPPYESFQALPSKETSDVDSKNCTAVAYELPDCKGKAYHMDDLKVSQGQCGHPPFYARSVFIQCLNRLPEFYVHPPTQTITQQTPVHTINHPGQTHVETSLHTYVNPPSDEIMYTTMTLVHAPKQYNPCMSEL